ncbi:hypothetical protein B0H21DRAFT_820386 [Amylocystis lapponica]|nr:hypothetical protein B0H21DRAFT_820386 [Amylocystis lapponica]
MPAASGPVHTTSLFSVSTAADSASAPGLPLLLVPPRIFLHPPHPYPSARLSAFSQSLSRPSHFRLPSSCTLCFSLSPQRLHTLTPSFPDPGHSCDPHLGPRGSFAPRRPDLPRRRAAIPIPRPILAVQAPTMPSSSQATATLQPSYSHHISASPPTLDSRDACALASPAVPRSRRSSAPSGALFPPVPDRPRGPSPSITTRRKRGTHTPGLRSPLPLSPLQPIIAAAERCPSHGPTSHQRGHALAAPPLAVGHPRMDSISTRRATCSDTTALVS